MPKLTNYTPGPRGINMKDGTTVWIEPGASADIDKNKVNGDLPDLGKESDAKADTKANDDALATKDARIAELEAQVKDQASQIEALTKPGA
jgi:hypothetical protein